ncbi:MAG: hypothetical protein IPM32_12685 [Ignavibacteriae bacterium]|nr:hypothetical protein [Ignavibacteriota bacterium]
MIYLFPFNLITIPFIKVIGHFSITPLLRLFGYLNYHSPFLLTIRYKQNHWEIHNGTIFDYLLNMKWSYRGVTAKQITIKNYLQGLLNIIDKLKKNNNPKNINVTGITYFINRGTISKIGFTEERVRLYRKSLFIIDYINLLIMFSFSKGKISFPNIFRLKKIKIDGEKLISSEKVINDYLTKFSSRILLN